MMTYVYGYSSCFIIIFIKMVYKYGVYIIFTNPNSSNGFAHSLPKAPVDLALMRRKLRRLVFERKDECQVACTDIIWKLLQKGKTSS